MKFYDCIVYLVLSSIVTGDSIHLWSADSDFARC